MKKLILLLALIAAGGFAMTKEEIKGKIITDAQDKNADMVKSERESLLKEHLIKNRGFTQQEIIDFAVEYSGKYPKNVTNGLDSELRSISILGNSYFRPLNTNQERKELKEISERSSGGFPSWAKYGLIGLVILGAGYFFFKGKK